ncbi:MAG TPA: MATE family efflux transporter [Chryseolinea sp.]|nr:MATE family efflux transporter [Chryseolinea sp.]
MTIKTHIKENFHLAYPVMLSNLGHVLIGVGDNIMVGHVGAAQLAAAGLANVIFNVLMLFGIGVSYAITPLVAAADGERNDKSIIETLRHGLAINFVNGIILVGIVMAGRNLLNHLDQPPEVVALAIPYLGIITFSLIPMLIFQSFKQFAEGLSNTKLSLVVIILTNMVNIAMNYVLIYGHAGFPAMGLNGAGWATLISRIFMAVAIAWYVYQSAAFKKYREGFSIGKYTKSLFNKMLHIGIPAGVQFIFEVAAFDFSLVMMGWLGAKTQAAHQIAINLATLSYMTTAGLAAAATIRVSYFLGRKDIKNLKLASYTMLIMALIMMSACAVVFMFGRNILPGFYVDDGEVLTIASSLLIVAGLFQLSDGTQVVCIAALRGLHDVKIPSVLIFISYWIIGLPLGYWLAFILGYGALGIWLGLFIGLTLTAIAMFLRFRAMVNKLTTTVESAH